MTTKPATRAKAPPAKPAKPLAPVKTAKGKQTTRSIPADTGLLLTVEEAARRLRCGRTFMYRLIGREEIQSILIGRRRRVPVVAIEEYIRLRAS